MFFRLTHFELNVDFLHLWPSNHRPNCRLAIWMFSAKKKKEVKKTPVHYSYTHFHTTVKIITNRSHKTTHLLWSLHIIIFVFTCKISTHLYWTNRIHKYFSINNKLFFLLLLLLPLPRSTEKKSTSGQQLYWCFFITI